MKSAPLEGWQLVWSDEFEGEGLPNSQWWDFEVGYLRNNELQYYTAKRLENCRQENGHLIIEARNDHYQGNAVTSASLTSQRAASWTYGRIEARAKVAPGRGTWPAIWMLGDNIGEVGWPHCGEIDIMEFVGYDPDTVHGTVHTTSYNHIQNTARGGSIDYDDLTQAMHTYAVEWEPEEIRFYVDDVLYYTFTNDGQGNDATWPFHRPQHLKLNLAIGGDWGGAFGVDPSLYPTQFLIDYVRVYQRPESPPYTVDLTARGPGSLRIEPQKDSYDAGEIVTLIADPDVGMRLGKWKNAQVARSLKTELQVDRSFQIEADFVDPTSLIQNPAFDAGFDGWYNYVDSAAAATLAVNAEGQATITVTDTGTADWHVQFGQGGFALENGSRYELTFEAKSLSGAPKLIAALSQNGAPYATFQAEPVALASALQTYTLAFTHSQASEANARVEFRLGTQLGAVAIDKVRLVNLDQNALSPYESWKRDHNIRPIDDDANPDRDLLPNLLEYLRQTDPFSPESHAPIAAVSINNGQATTSLNLDLEGREEEISLTRQHSADLTHWEDVEEVTLPFSRIKISANPPIQD
ncbi:family 16 glycosylhydrolase [Pelagicoccus sp. SDUM812005]|nr:family 16 glycosylhydrolase [Pelagicoccus sp. SDUM812005]